MSPLTITIVIIVFLIASVFFANFEGFQSLPQTRRNMSYDLRGDIPIPYHQVSPWNNPEVGPIYNRPLIMG